jgi:transcription elongation factor Elf1
VNELESCPFCGATFEKFTLSQEMTSQFEIGHMLNYPYFPVERQVQKLKLSCQCGCSFEKEVLYVSEFIEAWNRRAKDEPEVLHNMSSR